MTKNENENANVALFCLEYALKNATLPCTQKDITKAMAWVNSMAAAQALFNRFEDSHK